MGSHSYGLSWIDEDALFDVTVESFKKSIADSRKKMTFGNPPDPFTLAAQAVLTGAPLSDPIGFEPKRALNKTVSNNVGLWHQHVLGLAEGWEDSGTSGGGIDLRMTPGRTDPKFGKQILAEVKNRYNTIKSSDEKDVWDRLDFAARSNNAVAYVFQIVPKTPQRYDRPWNVSGRTARDHVRCCDGATAYELVFGRRDALKELYEIFPILLGEAAAKINRVDAKEAIRLYYVSMP